jgi:fluoride ion exporter CrcB/FEX
VCLHNDYRIRLAVSCRFSEFNWDFPWGKFSENLTNKCIFIILAYLSHVVKRRHVRFELQLISLD